MKSNKRISQEDKNFFSLVVKAIFTNPFSDERGRVVEQAISEKSDPNDHVLKGLLPEIDRRLSSLEQKGLKTIAGFSAEDRDLIKYVFLLKSFLGFVREIDDLIERQWKEGAKPIKAPFAQNMLRDLNRKGFVDEESLHYIALFYQLRRAFYFIEKSLMGDSPSMKELRLSLWNNVFTYDIGTYDRHLFHRMEDFSTFLLGETGTGKGSAAAAIGRSGYIPFDPESGSFASNFTETFVAINLSQFPDSLIESEIFGHRKGAFTGAIDNHKGVLELCSSHGSLFLDEIGDVSVPVQIKLLQVLQERTFTPVGSHAKLRFEGRVIAATNRPIEELRKEGNFRDDFYYRLCSDVITVPTLRQRIQEMPSELEQLVDSLISRMTGQESEELTQKVLETFKRDLPPEYPWPGNVRELEQAVRRILISRHYGGDINREKPRTEEELLAKIRSGSLEASELMSGYCQLLYQRHGTYEEVARRTQLDRRTVKKYLTQPPS